MATPPRIMSTKEADIQMMLAAEVHLGTKLREEIRVAGKEAKNDFKALLETANATSDWTILSKLSVCHKITNEETCMIKEDEANASTGEIVNQQIADLYAQIPLPMGTELNSVSKIDLHTVDVGRALQFLEFCAIFHKILGVKKGQGEYVLQDLLQGELDAEQNILQLPSFISSCYLFYRKNNEQNLKY